MKIIRNAVVTLKYEIFDGEGNAVERAGEPLVYLHGGHGGMFPRVEAELEGKAPADRIRVRLAPEDAFGPRDPELVRREPRSKFPGKIRVGMQFEGEMRHGDHAHPVVFRVVKLAEHEVTLDANHPLAGQPIEFRATVLDVRPASPEEIAHGHAHGPGGHHH
ncbi:MAG: peptidylprolyl isomerase [Burkholderiales bacterium]|nr:peptidylprolyl isomerase [Burkholderiales bacterium]